jgi:hypothetical protein
VILIFGCNLLRFEIKRSDLQLKELRKIFIQQQKKEERRKKKGGES